MIVLDASALLAMMFREAGHEQVEKVLGRFTRDGHSSLQVLTRLKATVTLIRNR